MLLIYKAPDRVIQSLIKDSFANYVLQKSIDIAKESDQHDYIERIKEAALQIKKPNNYSKFEVINLISKTRSQESWM